MSMSEPPFGFLSFQAASRFDAADASSNSDFPAGALLKMHFHLMLDVDVGAAGAEAAVIGTNCHCGNPETETALAING